MDVNICHKTLIKFGKYDFSYSQNVCESCHLKYLGAQNSVNCKLNLVCIQTVHLV